MKCKCGSFNSEGYERIKRDDKGRLIFHQTKTWTRKEDGSFNEWHSYIEPNVLQAGNGHSVFCDICGDDLRKLA